MVQELFGFVVRARYDMNGDQLTYPAGGSGARFGSGLDRADIAANQHGNVAVEQIFPAHKNDVRGLDHGVGRLDSADKTARFNHSEGVHDVAT